MNHRRHTPRRRSMEAEVIAATAGEDNWKTWAGRSHGGEGFEVMDLFRGLKRQFNREFVWRVPPAGTACPVCFAIPESKAEWHVTSSCGHAVCKDCLRGYAGSLVRDKSHTGPLRCPVCPLPLRPSDAIHALCDDPELVRLWDAKIRDELLRALPGYRHCPHCNAAKTEDSTMVGGGFVTPECLAPINKIREQEALEWLDHPLMKLRALIGIYLLYLYLYSARPSSSFSVDILNTFLVPFWFLSRMWLFGRHAAATEARKKLFAPITVECPCCDRSFILNAESELGNTVLADQATKEWMESNARPCPRCSVPISKIDGCNHMQCAHCRCQFCWACMRIGSSCRAYNCLNGAPYGNANAMEGFVHRHGRRDEGILDRIERIATASTDLDLRDAIALAASCLCYFGREWSVVQCLANVAVKTFCVLFSTGTITSLIMVVVLSARFATPVRRFLNIPDVEVRDLMDGSAQGRIAERLYDVDNVVERRLLAETLRRSMVER